MQGFKACIEVGVLVEGDVVLGLWAGDHKGVCGSASSSHFRVCSSYRHASMNRLCRTAACKQSWCRRTNMALCICTCALDTLHFVLDGAGELDAPTLSYAFHTAFVPAGIVLRVIASDLDLLGGHVLVRLRDLLSDHSNVQHCRL